jgi:hypothetical protein
MLVRSSEVASGFLKVYRHRCWSCANGEDEGGHGRRHHTGPMHLAAVFGIDDTTAIRYAAIARTLLATPAEHHDPGSREPKEPQRP